MILRRMTIRNQPRNPFVSLMTALPTTPRFVEYEKVYLLKNPFIRQESMDTLAYLKLFFPFRMPDFHMRGTESLWNVSGEDKMQAALAMTFRNEPRAKAMSFMRDYGERYDWLKEVFLDLAFTFVSAYMYYNDRDFLDQGWRYTVKGWPALKETRRAIIWSCATIP